MSSTKTRFKLSWKTVKDFFVDYADHSTIHGIGYIAEKGRPLLERIWWIIVFCISVLCCGKLIFDAWNINPIIISFAEKPTPIWQIPFPAVTVCPITYARSDRINIYKLYQAYESGRDLFKTLTEKEKLQTLAKNYMCLEGRGTIHYVRNYTNCNDCLESIREIKIPVEELFVKCKFRNREISCKESFIEKIVETNICYTFNSLEVYRQQNTSQGNMAEMNEDWSLDEGYKPSASAEAYPYRALGAGQKYGFSFLFKAEKKHIDYGCWMFGGFMLDYHMPNEVLRNTKMYYFTLETSANMIITPKIIKTSEDLRHYSPKKRKCYFNNERRLKYFKHYTQNHCEMECRADAILKKCSCLPIYIEKYRDVDVCGPALTVCAMDAADVLSDQNFLQCNCAPTCSSINFDSEMSITKLNLSTSLDFDYEYLDIGENIQVNIFFKENQFFAQQRKELYGNIDFLANCGGLLGLCLGVSVISFLEIAYFFTIRLWFNRRKYMTSDCCATTVLGTTQLIRPKTYLAITKDIFTDYFKKATIHGIKYPVDSSLTWLERVWWTIIIVISVLCCGALITDIYRRYDESPVTISYASETTSITHIPFPTITLCPQLISEDLPSLLYYFKKQNLSLYDLDERRKNISTSMVQVCDSEIFNDIDPDNVTNCDSCASTLKSLLGSPNNMFTNCNDIFEQKLCSVILETVVTEEGACFVFNNDKVFRTLNDTNEDNNEEWTLDGGYRNYSGQVDVHPRAGSEGSFYVVIQKILMIDTICKGAINGFKLYFHLPNEAPQIGKHYFMMPFHHSTSIFISPKVTITVPELRDFAVTKRQCYFSDERYLRFFRHYTQSNCEIECLVNLTLNRCGCLMFHIPRIPGIRFCGINDRKCYHITLEQNAEENINKSQSSTCHCLTTCTSITYDAEINYVIYPECVTTLSVSFLDNQFIALKRSQLFGKTEFLANFGGLLGLFLGFSIISILEFIYFWTIRLVCNFKMEFSRKH